MERADASLSRYVLRSHKKQEPVVVTRRGKPWALIQPIDERDQERLEWMGLARKSLAQAWDAETTPATTPCRRGQVVVVNVPFTELAGSKPRPALEVRADSFHAKPPRAPLPPAHHC